MHRMSTQIYLFKRLVSQSSKVVELLRTVYNNQPTTTHNKTLKIGLVHVKKRSIEKKF